MRCPFCQCPNNRVLESRSAESGQSVRRRRECLDCGRRFTTYERIEFVPIIVVKRNGDRESFDRSKLLKGIACACEKTGISALTQENFVDEIEAELQQRSSREVSSRDIGELVLRHLRPLNEVAYVRFASVYRQFTGVSDFIQVLEHLQQHPDSSDNPSVDSKASATSAVVSAHFEAAHHRAPDAEALEVKAFEVNGTPTTVP